MSCHMFEFYSMVDKFRATLNIKYPKLILFYVVKYDKKWHDKNLMRLEIAKT